MGLIRAVAPGAFAIAVVVPSTASAERVVYINLDPTTLVADAGQDPTMNSYSTGGFTAGPISGWPALSDDDRAKLMYVLREATVPFDITFTYDRPAAGPYDMVVYGTGPDNTALFPGLGCSAAIGLADCADMNDDNISFLFYGCMSAAQQAEMNNVAFNSLVALGFGWGLENLSGSGQVMASYSVFGIEFGDMCTMIQGASQCEHMGCAAGQQNSSADITAAIGARVDDGPPVVTILSPENLAVVEGGVGFVVDATITDKFGGLSASLEIVEAKVTQDLEDPPDLAAPDNFSWLISLPAGEATWTLRVSGTDADGNVTTEEVVVCVDVDQCDIGPGTGGSESSTSGDDSTTSGEPPVTTDIFPDTTEGSGGSSTGGTGGGPIDPTEPGQTGFGIGPAGTGCHCRSGSSTPPWWMLLLLFGMRRRGVALAR